MYKTRGSACITFLTLNKRRRDKSAHGAAQLLRRARAVSDEAMALAEDVALLVNWFRHDILTVAGPCYSDRCDLYDFLVAELKARASKCPHRLEPICRALQNQRDDLLAFARRLDQDLEQLGEELQIPAELARCLLKTLSRDERDPRRWAEEAAVRKQLRGRFHAVQLAVAALAEETVRASSLVENLNSRLRSYFFLRRHLVRQRYLMNYGGMQQAKSSRRIPFRFSHDSLVFVCDLRARLF